jgi:predicted MPP superfamily phosphohydrolase
MIPFIFAAAILSLIMLFAGCLAYAFGSYSWGYWTSWAGSCGAITVCLVIIGTAMIKALEAVIPAILEKALIPKDRWGKDYCEGFDSGRRRFLTHSLNIGLVAASGSLAFHGVSEGMRLPCVKETEIEIDRLPLDLEGFRIVQITDLHISATIRRNHVQNLVERINALTPDIVAFTGDIADDTCAEIRHDAAPLSEIAARNGKFFVTGNHEYMFGAEEWMQEMERMGFTVLMNDHRLISRGRALLHVGGVVDYSASSWGSHVSSPAKAMEGGSMADVKILLAHQPRSVYEAARAGFDLQLSGHTHGGQFGPFRWLLGSLGQPFQSGLYRYEKIQIYVSNGAGYCGPPVRIGAPSEISLLLLQKSGVCDL